MINTFVLVLLGFFFTVASGCQLFLWVIRRKHSLSRARDDGSVSARRRELHEYHKIHHAIDVTSIAFIWYSISLSFTLFNKWFMQEWRGGFNFPVTITTVHMFMKFFISMIWSMSPSVDKIAPLSWSSFLLVVLPIGSLTAADILLTNTSMLYLPLSIVTTIKGSSLVFTFLWGVLLQIESFKWSLLFAVVGITAGLGMSVSNSVDVNMMGIALAFSSAASGGLRWALMQLLELKDSQSKSVMVTLYRFSPASALSIIPVAWLLEEHKLTTSSFGKHQKTLTDAILLCVVGGVFAFFLIIAEVRLLRLTSSLTMSVFGQVKEIIQIVLAMIIFHENLTVRCVFGIAISIFCSCLYRYIVVVRDEEDNLEFQSGSALAAIEMTDAKKIDDMEGDMAHSVSRNIELKEQELRLLEATD